MTRALWAAAALGVLLFWAGVLAAGATVDGYAVRDDYISSLAGRGSPVAVLAIASLLASAVAHAATALAVLGAWRTRAPAAFLGAAALATAAIAGFRVSCPDGPAGCSRSGAPGDWIDRVHTGAVIGYELAIVGAMLALAVASARRGPGPAPLLGAASVVVAVASLLLLARSTGDDIGLWQRLWVATNLGWLLVAARAATARERGG